MDAGGFLYLQNKDPNLWSYTLMFLAVFQKVASILLSSRPEAAAMATNAMAVAVGLELNSDWPIPPKRMRIGQAFLQKQRYHCMKQ